MPGHWRLRFLCGLLHRLWACLAQRCGEVPPPGSGGSSEGPGSGAPRRRIVEDLVVPASGPQGAVSADDFSLVQVYDMGWLVDPSYQRMLQNLVSFATVMGPLVSHQLGTTCLGSASMVVGIFRAVN